MAVPKKESVKKRVAKKSTEKVEVLDTEKIEDVEEIRKPKSFRELRKLLHRDTEVLVMNNTQGGFFYRCPKTHMEINMSEFGDTEVVTIELLEAMKNRAKKLFKNYCLIVVDVYPDDELEGVIEILDVLAYLGISDLYENINDELEYNGEIYGTEFFDNLIIKKSKDEFNKIVSKMNNRLLVQLTHRAVVLYQSGKFDSRYKMEQIQDKLGLEDLFANM